MLPAELLVALELLVAQVRAEISKPPGVLLGIWRDRAAAVPVLSWVMAVIVLRWLLLAEVRLAVILR